MAEPISCPSCEQPLNVPETFHGQMVECPDCKYRFIAGVSSSGMQSGAPAAVPVESTYESREEARTSRRYDDERDSDDDRPMRRRADLMPHRGNMIQTLGILSIFLLPFVLGSIAWILGNADLKAMEEGRMDPAGESQTRTGRLLGKVMVIINLVIIALAFIGLCVFFGLIMATAGVQQGGGKP